METYRIAVLIPCYNEQVAIPEVVRGFRSVLKNADIYVYDNNSTDLTREVALEAGAIVRTERLQGKGNVVRRMFADIEADVYLLVDGDNTYDPASAPSMINLLVDNQLDMVCGRRVSHISAAYRKGHRFGNKMLTALVGGIFGQRFSDMLTGYRVFSRRFVKSFPALSSGFEIETELTVHALELRMPTAEVDTPYLDRPEGSTSKLRTYRDGWRILMTIALLVREERPLRFFGLLAILLAVTGIVLSIPVFVTYAETGLVPRLPTAVLSTGLMLAAFLAFAVGMILDIVTLGRREVKRLRYLQFSAPGSESSSVRHERRMKMAR